MGELHLIHGLIFEYPFTPAFPMICTLNFSSVSNVYNHSSLGTKMNELETLLFGNPVSESRNSIIECYVQ